MRLFLSSYRAGRHNERLIEFLGDVKKVGVITNAKDYKTPEGRLEKVGEVFDFFKSLSIEPLEMDLRPFFNKDGAQEEITKHKFIWLAGGNVFLLRRALKYSRLDNFIVQKVREGSVIYGGESAGAIIAGPTLKESEMEGDEDSPDFLADGYKKEIIWDGLSLINYVPVPHYQTPDYSAEIEKYIKRLDKIAVQHKEITDDQAIIINNSKEKFLK